MTAFEKHLGRSMLPTEGNAEREWYISQVLSPDEIKKRALLVKREKPKQLKLEL